MWNPELYLQFDRERELPCRDLINRLHLKSFRNITDLGCGPGNSTALLQAAFPNARITGLDASPEMLAAARQRLASATFSQGNIQFWTPSEPIDLMFSNAALQWVDNHKALFPRLLSGVKPGGYLAVQMPYRDELSPISQVLREVENQDRWAAYFQKPVRTWSVQEPAAYYNWLCDRSDLIDIWLTDYYHPLPDARHVIDWYRGTSLQPYMAALPSEYLRQEVLEFCYDAVRKMYPVQMDEKIMFSIRRLFVVARR